MLARYVNDSNFDVETITLKYLTVGHTYMSADSFHARVEREMKTMGKLFDFADFIKCVCKAGDVVVMNFDDFKYFESGLSQSKLSKSSRPLLANVYVAQFRKGSYSMFYQTHEGGQNSEFNEAQFLSKPALKKFKESVQAQTCNRGITTTKKQAIIDNLSLLMPFNRREFYAKLQINENSVDLINQR